MVNYQTISSLVDQIPADTWDVLREIKERHPAMMLLELIDCRQRTLQKPRCGATQPRQFAVTIAVRMGD
jgi:hypothetical protein